jgi:UDP-GlcNAc3NAcA epimerase
MYDVALFFKNQAKQKTSILSDLGLQHSGYVLATCHRAENTNDPVRLNEIVMGIAEVAQKIPLVFALHPRTKQYIHDLGCGALLENVIVIEPLPFLDMVILEQSAKLILTDSGGVQKEAFFYSVPCLTMRDESEWLETINSGMNELVGASRKNIIASVNEILLRKEVRSVDIKPYGKGDSGKQILDIIIKSITK